MTLKKKLDDDFKEAMKNRQTVRKETISFVRAAIKQYEVDNRKEIDDAGIASIIAKQVKMRRDALADFESAGRTDLLDAYNAEIEVLMDYMPEQLTDEKIKEIVEQTALEIGVEKGSGKAAMGKLMGAVMPKVKGAADGSSVKTAVEGFLG